MLLTVLFLLHANSTQPQIGVVRIVPANLSLRPGLGRIFWKLIVQKEPFREERGLQEEEGEKMPHSSKNLASRMRSFTHRHK